MQKRRRKTADQKYAEAKKALGRLSQLRRCRLFAEFCTPVEMFDSFDQPVFDLSLPLDMELPELDPDLFVVDFNKILD